MTSLGRGFITRVPEHLLTGMVRTLKGEKSMVNDLIAGMAQQLGLSMELNDEGACRLVFEDKYTVDIQVQEGQENRFFLLSTVGQSEAPTEAQLRTLLDANLFGQGTGEAALAYDPEMEEIVLQRCFDARYVDLGQLMGSLEEFVNIVASWTERLGEQGADKSRSSPEATALAQGDPSFLRI
jgi:Tir chaperone protein (CesT) family